MAYDIVARYHFEKKIYYFWMFMLIVLWIFYVGWYGSRLFTTTGWELAISILTFIWAIGLCIWLSTWGRKRMKRQLENTTRELKEAMVENL